MDAPFFYSGLGRRSSVLAIVPYFHKYEKWLAQGLASLTEQTRPPENIVVVDDASPKLPLEIVEKFPSITLLVADENVGMYALAQQVAAVTDYDAYLFQDADDWSAPDRLAELLQEAERSAADMVGCQQEFVCEGAESKPPLRFPLDCNYAIFAKPSEYPILLTTSIISRPLIERLGGFADGLRYAADTEFVRRAVLVTRVVNIPKRAYFRRIHGEAATAHPETGHGSPLRKAIHVGIDERWRTNCARLRNGELPDLNPFAIRQPVALRHACGPELPSPTRSFVQGTAVSVSAAEIEAARRQYDLAERNKRRYGQTIAGTKDAVCRVTPPGALVAVINRGDAAMLELDGRTAWSFPQTQIGVYTGYHPRDCTEVLANLDVLCSKGLEYLVFPETSFWWLEHYKGLLDHLETYHEKVWGDGDCIIFHLNRASRLSSG